MKDYRRERQSYLSRAGGDEGCEDDRRGGRVEEEDRRQRRVEKSSR